MAGAGHECLVRFVAGLVSLESRGSAVFPDRREFRSGPVRILAVLDRSLFDRGNRWRRDTVYFCHGMDTGALAPWSDMEKNVGSGMLLGLLLLAKFSTAPMFVLALLWMLLLGADKIIRSPTRWNWGKTAAALLVALFVVWAGYFFHVSHLTVRDGTLTATFPNWNGPSLSRCAVTETTVC